MSAGSDPGLDHDIQLGHDDYSLTRVPESERYSWITVAVQRFGQLSALSQFLLGATLGFGMTFWNAFLALTLGAVILEVVAIFVGIAGMREGLSTSVLSRWTGFGRYGSSIIGLVFAVSLIGWFGVQNAVFAEGVHSLIGGIPVWAWSIITGAAVTLVVIYGFISMAWVAYITVPAFLLLAGYSITNALLEYRLGELVTSAPPGETLSLAAGTTIVAGGFIVGGDHTGHDALQPLGGGRYQADRGGDHARRVHDRPYRGPARPRAQEPGRHRDRDLHERLYRHDHPHRGDAEDQRLEPLLIVAWLR
jgi:cytosine permease